ncbi:hypothetical protein NDU88_000551 [Pleurodeles waltl]|uniref:Uncharacterized protein n=1 Tax=Pleurodeles waltl TaxID=8319 RepID=A0AAV7SWV7_PLEWA|nr:hypothetical protein NDU88_000551 [Pleurodeles waltl]
MLSAERRKQRRQETWSEEEMRGKEEMRSEGDTEEGKEWSEEEAKLGAQRRMSCEATETHGEKPTTMLPGRRTDGCHQQRFQKEGKGCGYKLRTEEVIEEAVLTFYCNLFSFLFPLGAADYKPSNGENMVAKFSNY